MAPGWPCEPCIDQEGGFQSYLLLAPAGFPCRFSCFCCSLCPLSRLLPPTVQPPPLFASPCPPHLLTGLPLRTAWHFHEAAGSRGQHRIFGISQPWVQILIPALTSYFFPFNISNLDKFFNLSKLSLPHLKSEMLPLGPQDYPGVCQGKLLVKNQKKKKRLSRVLSV